MKFSPLKEDQKMKEPTHNRYRRQLFYYVVIIAFAFVFCYAFLKLTTSRGSEQQFGTASEAPQKLGDYRNPVESLDGVGYKFEKEADFIPDPRYEALDNLAPCDLSRDKDPIPDHNNPSLILDNFHNCVNPILQKMFGQPDAINLQFVSAVSQCDKLPIWENLKIEEFANLHEIKWTILPKCKDTVNNMVTLGIGHDTKAEELLNRTLPNTNFYGADPIINPNLQLYSGFGKFFPFAIGRKGGMSRFRVLPDQNQKTRVYSYQDVTTVGMVYFLNDILNLKRIDIAWIDIEGGEFEFLDMIHRDGPLDQKNIAICQFNIEVHSKFHPPGVQIFHDFIFRILEDKRYVFLKPMYTDIGVHRLFFVNMEDKECVRKFIQ